VAAGINFAWACFRALGVRCISICDRGPVINYAANWKSDERSICKLPACLSIISLPFLGGRIENLAARRVTSKVFCSPGRRANFRSTIANGFARWICCAASGKKLFGNFAEAVGQTQ
jgi:hypothetical protein